jgi:regulator of protease activity HflC (stomatin/prohibitin superfamily)
MKGMELILFIITLILAIAAIALIAKGRVETNDGDLPLRGAGVIVLFVAALTLVFNVFTVVPTRNIAVSMAFGKPTGTLGNGFHLIAPWESTEEYDAAIQTLKFDGDAKDDDSDPAPTVRLANGATARVDVPCNGRSTRPPTSSSCTWTTATSATSRTTSSSVSSPAH